MAEELIMNVKSNIKSVTKDTQDLNSTLEEQKDILLELKKEEIKLQQERAKMSDWEKSISGIDKKLEHLKFSIKDQTLAVKGLTEEQKKANKVQKEQEQAIKGTIGNFRVFGVSLNGIKKSVSGIIPLIKLMFRSITAGIMSTGIGVFVIAFGSLVTYVTQTKEGMDKLNVLLAKMGATFNVVKDRISGFGKIVGKIFTGKLSLKDAVKETKENFADMGKEIKEETKLAGELEKATQKLRDVENDFLITRAKKNKQLAEARLLSEDEETSLKERKTALEDAITLEKQLLQDELDHQAERVRILEEQTKMSDSSAADEKALAEAKVDLINLETKSLTTQKRLKREMNSLDNEILADEKRIADEKQKIIDDEFDAMIKANDEWNKAEQERLKKLEDDAKEEIRIAREVADAKVKIRDAHISNIEAGIGLVKSLAGENKKIQAASIIAENAVGIAKTIIATQTANAGALATPQAILTSGAAAIPVIAANNIAAGISIAASIAATAQGLSALGTGGGGGGGNLPTGGGASPQTPAPQMMSGAFELGGGIEPEPARAYVVSDDITNNQNKLAIIRRRATI
jgi:chromosome segregation ATPase